jgi:pimeloyl-[acyl-carrier protein] synthase
MVLGWLKRLFGPKLFGPQMLADPYPFYARLRSADPVHRADQFGGWVLTRYADVVTVLRSPDASAERIPAARQRVGPEFQGMYDLREHSMLNADAPRHTRLRLLVNKAFTPRTVEELAPFIRNFVDNVLGAAQSRGRVDLMADLAFPLPATVIAEMLGVPPEDRDRFKKWSDDSTAAVSNLPSNLPSDVLRKSVAATEQLKVYFGGIIAQRRAEPRDDLISALVKAHEAEDRLSEDELLANSMLLLTAGHETTTNLIGNGTLALLRHPDQMRRLRDDPSLIPSAVEELLRYDSPVQFTSRILKADLPLGGKVLRAGQAVLLVLGAANRDPEQFPDPDRLDVGRPDNKHIAFGLGPHFCLGAPLARLEGRIVFEELLRRTPGLRLDGPPPRYRQNFNLRGLESLQVALQ